MSDRFQWARFLAFVTGLVNQELLRRNEYLAAENRILRAHLPSRLRLSEESIRFQGSCSFLDRLFFGLWPEAWIPASKRLLPLFIEHPRPDLQQQMRSALAPLHLLQLHHSLAHHLIHSRFHKAGRDPFPVAIALSVVGQELLVAFHVGVQFLDSLQRFVRVVVLAFVRRCL